MSSKENRKKGWKIALLVMVILGIAIYYGAWKLMQPTPEYLQHEKEAALAGCVASLALGEAAPADAEAPEAPMESISYIEAGDNGGKWETLQSGETIYVYPNEDFPRNQWVKDGDVLYYVDATGCRMIENYTHDGYYVGKNGALDPSVQRLEANLLPESGKKYASEGGSKTWTFHLEKDAAGKVSGTAHMAYSEDIGYKADYHVHPLGHSSFSLYNVLDDFDACHLVVLHGGRILRVSAAGETEQFEIKP